MHRIDGAGHVDHLFVAEDPTNLRPPTEITPDIMNAFQEELASFIEWAGLILSKGDNTQMIQALLAKFTQVETTDSVITGAGISINHTDPTLLRQAITKMIQTSQRSVIVSNVTFAGAVTGTGKAVYWDSANSRFDLAIADGSVKQACVGFADVPNSQVYAFGDAVLFAGLTPGARYYLDSTTAGAITATAPTNAVFVGIARNATEAFVDIDAQASSQVKQIPSISVSVASNAMTGVLGAETLDFRSTILTNGTPVTRTASTAQSLVVPSGATLGTTSGVAARIIWGRIDNAGTLEPFVCNLAGGQNLDETTLISTTAISASSTAANVVYSATARSNVAFRIRGFCDVTQIAAAWSTEPTLVQGAGGMAMQHVGAITSAASVATTSGTAIDFTGIPSWAKRITLIFNSVSTTGASSLVARIGSGSISSSGYVSNMNYVNNSSNSCYGVADATGFVLTKDNTAASAFTGMLTICQLSSGIYVASGVGNFGAGAFFSGLLSLGASLDRVRLTTLGGTDTFDAGSINISYE